MVNEQWRNHSGPTKRRRKPNGPPSHNTLISASSESVLQLSSLFFCVALCWSHIFFVAQFSLTHRNNSWSTTHNEPSLEEHGIVHAYTYSATSLATSGCNSKANNFGSNYIVNCQWQWNVVWQIRIRLQHPAEILLVKVSCKIARQPFKTCTVDMVAN